MLSKFILFAFVSTICSWHYAIGGPTVVPANPFNPDGDAETLRHAMKGWGTKEGDINEVLCKKPYQQREQIAQAFAKKYDGRDLFSDLEKETSGGSQKLYRRLMESSGVVLAYDLHDYIEGTRTEPGGVTEIVCGTDVEDKNQLAAAYMKTFNMSVLDHVKKYKSKDEPYQNVLINFCWKTYCTYPTIDAKKALAAAQYLNSINCETDGENFKVNLQKYLQTYCLPDLKMIFNDYKTVANRDITEAIRAALKQDGDEEEAWVTLTLSIEDRDRYYADLFYEAVNGAGTDEDRVFRLVLQTCERDLGDIDAEYEKIHDESLFDRLKGDFRASANVKDCLKKLTGE